MIRKNKWTLIVTSVIILLPILAGLILWDQLPEQMPTHWGTNGTPDGWSGKPLGIFLPPFLLLFMHWICIGITAADPGNKNQTPKAIGMVLWISPVLSLLIAGLSYSVALGREINMMSLMPVVFGVMFVLIGNYLPKCKRNHSIGIKILWTLHNDENWNATHRFGGKVWLIGGLVIIACSFLPGNAAMLVFFIATFVLVLLPVLYSWFYYKQQRKEGLPPVTANPATKWILLGVAVLLGFLFFFAGTGDIQVVYNPTQFTVDTNHWDDLTVEYNAVDHIQYRDEMVSGSRVGGFGGLRVLLGNFENEEFGRYTRYTYTSCDSCVIVTAGERTLVLNGKDRAATKNIYETLLTYIDN